MGGVLAAVARPSRRVEISVRTALAPSQLAKRHHPQVSEPTRKRQQIGR